MARPLSPITLAVWRFLAEYIDRRGYAPTLREVAAGCFLSSPAAYQHLLRLEERELIEREAYRARAIKLLERPPQL